MLPEINNYYLVRHGEKAKEHGDPGLTEMGKTQAKLTGQYFQNMNIDQILSSPLKRTMETALCISDLTHIGVDFDKNLRERIWEPIPNMTFIEFLDLWEKTTVERDYQPPSGDSSRKAGERFKAVLDRLTKNHKNKNIILVSHGGVIADLLRNLFPEEHIRAFYSDILQIGLLECSITHLVAGEGKYEIKSVNFVGHLSQ